MTTVYERPLTPAEYLVRERAAEYKNEYFAGEVVSMSGASRRHVRIVTDLARHLGFQLAGGPCEPFVADMRVRILAVDAYVYPDVAIVCGEARFEDRYLDTLLNPAVLVEVLSPSTERLDRGRKAAAYRELPGLQEYALIHQDEPCAEVYRRTPEGTWACEVVRGLDGTLSFPSVECAVSMAEVYERVFGPRARP
jgi:Uma2 family endonuclease